jgi:hypothetical protein
LYILPTQRTYGYYTYLRTNSEFFVTSLLVTGDPGTLGTPIYVFTVETPRPVEARRNSYTQLLWKLHDPSRENTPIYLVTFETSRHVRGKGYFMYAVTVETPRHEQGRCTHLVTYETSRPVEARHNLCTHLLWKPRDPGRQVTPIYLFTFENSRPMGARKTSCRQLLRKPRDRAEKAHPFT